MAAEAATATPGTPALVLRRLWQRMIGQLANPLASKELLARMRGPRTFVIATLELLPLAALAAGLYVMMSNDSSLDSSSNVQVGRLFFVAITAVELGLICLLAPALTADLISGERERQTLDLLLVTPLSRQQIVVGKLVAALGSLLLLIVLALPIQAVAVLLGGVGLEELGLGLVILTLTATTYGCVGLYWSARLSTTRAAMLFSYVTMLLGTLGLPLLIFLMALGEGLFRMEIDEWIWPLAWLINGPEQTTRQLENNDLGGLSAVVLHLEATIGQLLAASNPLIAGVTSAAGFLEGRPLIAFETVAQTELLYVAPWILFAVMHVLATALLIWLTGRALRRART